MVKDKKHNWSGKNPSEGGGMVYFLGFVGAAVYFIQTATGFWDGVLGILQAVVWPAYVVYDLLQSFYG